MYGQKKPKGHKRARWPRVRARSERQDHLLYLRHRFGHNEKILRRNAQLWRRKYAKEGRRLDAEEVRLGLNEALVADEPGDHPAGACRGIHRRPPGGGVRAPSLRKENSMSLDAPKVYFARIDPRWNKSTRQKMWENKLFSVMFDNGGSVDPGVLAEARDRRACGEDAWWAGAGYSGRYAVDALERMQAAIDERALVFVDFRGLNMGSKSVMIGYAEGPLRIVEVEEAYTRDGKDRVVTSRYKCMGIAEPRFFRLDPVLAAQRPRQATFTRWPSAAHRVRAAYEGSTMPRDASALTPAQLEVLCYEYLRDKNPGLRLLLPIGRTLADMAIYGLLSDSQRVVAQVTYFRSSAATVIAEAKALAAVAGADRRVLFAGQDAISQARATVSAEYRSVVLVAFEDAFSEVESRAPAFVYALRAPTR